MIPASLFLGFTASILWCAEVIFKSYKNAQVVMFFRTNSRAIRWTFVDLRRLSCSCPILSGCIDTVSFTVTSQVCSIHSRWIEGYALTAIKFEKETGCDVVYFRARTWRVQQRGMQYLVTFQKRQRLEHSMANSGAFLHQIRYKICCLLQHSKVESLKVLLYTILLDFYSLLYLT